MRPAAETLLSYLVGLAPLGTPIAPPFDWIIDDLGYSRNTAYLSLADLVKAGAVERLTAKSGGGIFGLLCVLKRPEAFGPVEREPRAEAHRIDPFPLRADWYARLAEIPDDTRDFTARYFGDPVPGRGALARRATEHGGA